LAEAWHDLGLLWHRHNDTPQAADCLRHAAAIDGEGVDPIADLADLWRRNGAISKALTLYRRTLPLAPHQASLLAAYAETLWASGHELEARCALVRALAIESSPHRDVRLALWRLVAVAAVGADDIARARRSFLNRLKSIAAGGLPIDSPLPEAATLRCRLARHGLDDRSILEALAAIPSAAGSPTDLRRLPSRPPTQRLGRKRVAFLSAHLHDRHPVGPMYNPIVRALAQVPAFDVMVFFVGGPLDHGRHDWPGARVIVLENDPGSAMSIVAARRPDLLIFPDVGTTALSERLARVRLAPCQLALSGHGGTTGFDTVDWTVSSAMFEPADGECHYSGRLARFSSPGFCLPRALAPSHPLRRRALNLPDKGRIYFCPVRLQDVHPDMDPIVAEILAADPDGHVCFSSDALSSARDRLALRRMRRQIGSAVKRVRLLPAGDRETMLHRLAISDVALDPPHGGSVAGAGLCLSVGIPMVTWPGRYARGRIMAGLYRTAGIDDCTVNQLSAYATRAVDIAADPSRREGIRHRSISAANAEPFAVATVVAEFRTFLEGLV
jgi:hypothetical protein